MDIISDLQLHSRFARACSKNITLDKLEEYAKIKGLNLLSTGDFQHPLWNKEIKEKLKEDDNGILWSKNKFPFLLGSEVSLMFSKNGRRAVHLLMFAPNGEVADQMVDALGKKGRLDYDGRPIFGMTCVGFVEMMKEIDDKIEIIPAHCMTSWFGLFGSKSGFDSLKDCFEDKTHKIYAIESGMSANPSMLWRLKEKVNIVSFSDAHSFWPFRLGREATIFDIKELSYENIVKAIRTGIGLKSTIETFPEYGKYHYDGHRNCKFSCSPNETKNLNEICPVCKSKLTLGVEYRIEKLAKAGIGYKTENAKPFFKLLPLQELISFSLGTGILTKKAWGVYNNLINAFGNELNILLEVKKEELFDVLKDEKLVEIILKSREGKLRVKPGFDGEYGKIEIEEQSRLV